MRWIVLIFLMPILAIAQGASASDPHDKFERYISLYSSVDGTQNPDFNNLFRFTEKLEAKRTSFKNEKQFLNHLFIKAHQKFLKDYEEYSGFSEMLSTGKYNCLTGTALYALLLEHFGFKYEIIETNYHIFLLAQTNVGKILFEATDPVNGFVDNSKKIESRINTYKQNIIQETDTEKTYYRYNFDLYNVVDLDQVAGLFHYNLAIVSFNKNDLESSVLHLNEAITRYESPRIQAFSDILLLSLVESKMESSVKENCLRKVQSLRKRKMHLVANASSSIH
jgi:hypothetical protein